jgi:hypothetical protein
MIRQFHSKSEASLQYGACEITHQGLMMQKQKCFFMIGNYKAQSTLTVRGGVVLTGN